ncbi:Tim44 domain-containing protein [Viridibacterium curvum]|uniref:TIM44-like domain-containing protein n=1 Tax=Viridibacterium curvum TaxID=1101404 RepID=A0ABP9QPT9_9RHOO
MFKRFALSLFVLVAALGLSVEQAEAKRLGGGGSVGMQRTMPQRQATMPPASAQRPATPAPTPAAQPSGWRKWAGPLAGLAAGLGLAALASHLGLGAEFGSVLLMILVAVVAFALIRRFMAARSPQPATAAGPGWQQGPAHFESQQAYGSSQDSSYGSSAPVANIPADFDVAGFSRQAKVNFIRLQAANDAGNLDDIREFTTPEMFAEIKMDIDSRRGASQKTDVVNLDAEVLEVAEEGNRYVVSVRFFGLLREEKDASPTQFDEVWHLTKPRDGSRGWTLAGIQQVA